MMSTYAFIVENAVFQVIEIPKDLVIDDMFTPEFVAACVDITKVDPAPQERWTYVDGVFSAPVEPVPTPEEILARNTAARDYHLAVATSAIAPLQDALDLDEATPAETALLKKWKQFRVAVNRVDLTLLSPPWPKAPQ
jgi:hypothetical protein